jgi:5-methylcytosine-specific restriction protein A
MIERACTKCGASFQPQSREHRYCQRCIPRGRENRSPSTQAQDAHYARNRLIVLRGNPRCALRITCKGALATTVDHIVAVANGGTNALSNLQPACSPCNRAKSSGPAMPASLS